MLDTMLVRANGGAWETLRPLPSLPEGGVRDVFGDDIGPVIGATVPVVVVAAEPALATGRPDALCVDVEGAVWAVLLDLAGSGDDMLAQLVGCGGSLTGCSWTDFAALCDGGESGLVERVASFAPTTFDEGALAEAVADNLAHGRIHLTAVVAHAGAALVQSMRFLNASGADARLFEAVAYAGGDVSALVATPVDVGRAGATHVAQSAPAPTAASSKAQSRTTRANSSATSAPEQTPATTEPEPELDAADTDADAASADAAASPGTADDDAFGAAVAAATDEATAVLARRFEQGARALFDVAEVTGTGEETVLDLGTASSDGDVHFVQGCADGSIVVSFDDLGNLDSGWSVRSDLCQGMERLLGTELGDVRKISQLNLVISEHLMDETLVDALVEILGETLSLVRSSAKTPAAA